MPTLVMKFGGTSVANLDRIRRAAKRVGVEVAKGYDVIVIVSAMSGKTNELVGWVNETSPLFDAREYDAVVSSGENVTAGLMALTLQEMNVPARSWQGWQVPLKTTSAHSQARIEEIGTENINAKFGEGMKVAVVLASKASAMKAASPHWVAVALTPQPWPLLLPLGPSVATSTPTWMVFTQQTRAFALRRASWTASLLKRCWNWRRWARRFCKPVPLNLLCAIK